MTSLICSCTGFDEIRNEIFFYRKKIRPVVFLNGFPPELIWIVFSKKLEPRFRSDFFATVKNNISSAWLDYYDSLLWKWNFIINKMWDENNLCKLSASISQNIYLSQWKLISNCQVRISLVFKGIDENNISHLVPRDSGLVGNTVTSHPRAIVSQVIHCFVWSNVFIGSV